MSDEQSRREILKLLGIGGVVFASGLIGCGGGVRAASAPMPTTAARKRDFFFLQLTDTHWGFKGPPNPNADTTLRHAVDVVNASALVPDFIMFTGDLTHTTDDGVERRRRMKEFREIVSQLKVKDVRFIPGEHDAAPDEGQAFREIFGETHHAFDHEGVHFIALDNVSLPGGALGDAQLGWLEADLAKVPKDTEVVVFAHRPLFDLFPEWEWATRDGARAIEILERRDAVTVFYGHIHQEHHHTTGKVVHHAARSLIFPMPAPGSVPKKAPVPWDASASDHGLGYRSIRIAEGQATPNEIVLT